MVSDDDFTEIAISRREEYDEVDLTMRVSNTADFIDQNMQYLIMFMIILAVLVFIMIVYIVCRMTKTRKVRIQKLRSSQKLDPQFVIDDSKADIITRSQKRKKLNM